MSGDSAGDQFAGTELLELFGTLSLRLADAGTLQETLQEVVDLSHELITNCDGVSLMLISKGGFLETPAYSTEAARDSDMAQHETGEGPCLDALYQERTILLADLESDERWPAYRSLALELGVRSMMSFQLFVTGDNLGALDVYSRQPNAFDRRQQIIGQVFATHASIAMKAALTEAGLNISLRSRDVIGQAKGVLMARRHMTADMAFDALRRLSQDRNIPVRELAAQIVERGEIP